MLRNWDAIKRTEAGREPGIFGEVPENLPGPLYARKVQRRAASTGFDFDHVPYEAVRGELDELEAAGEDREARFHEVGDVLFAAVNLARKLKVDPELALRAASERFRGRVEARGDPGRIGRPGLERSGPRGPARVLRAAPPRRECSPGAPTMSQIETVHARQILDSRGNPTVEVELALRSGATGRAAVPSGASTGEFEATELRDGGDAYLGKGVTQAVAQRQRRDRRGDRRARRARPGGPRRGADRARRHAEQEPPRRERDPRRLARRGARRGRGGGPAAVALPRRRVGARSCPVPMMNVLNGGAHADNSVDFQEFMVVPVGAARFSDALRMGAEVFHHLKKHLHDRGPRRRRRRRGRLRARTWSPTRRRSRRSSRASRRPATRPARTS